MSSETRKQAHQEALEKLNWAEQHIQKLDTAISEFRNANLHSFSVKENSDTGEITHYAANVPAIPARIPMIAGDALHGLRCALDYLACGLVERVTPNTKFPVAHSPETYRAVADRVVEGIGQDALEALNSIKPYQGGDWLIWLIHKLNNIDKHRLLLTMCLVNAGRTFTPNDVPPVSPNSIRFTTSSGLHIIMSETATPPVELYAGKELLTLPADQAKQDVRFYTEICFNEPGLAERYPLSLTLKLMSGKVGQIIKKLSPYLIR